MAITEFEIMKDRSVEAALASIAELTRIPAEVGLWDKVRDSLGALFDEAYQNGRSDSLKTFNVTMVEGVKVFAVSTGGHRFYIGVGNGQVQVTDAKESPFGYLLDKLLTPRLGG